MSVSLPVRVYYEDTDASGVVYHAAYLRYFERARTEWLRALGGSHRDLLAHFGVAFTVATITVDYLRPARLDDALCVVVDVEKVRRASLEFVESIHPQAGEAVLARARVRIACVDVARFRPCGLPDALRERLSAPASLSHSTAVAVERSSS
ncbi:MAG TPA: tol-pal system-associated acyl-CoA thioesterase [Nevskiaceae bacterium]|nr:tol-pal system-associated acyl-CoA thioesterase [Nevskiaceae bacterium]